MLPKMLSSPVKLFQTETSQDQSYLQEESCELQTVSTIAKLLKKVETHVFFHSLQLARVMILYRALCVELRWIIYREIISLRAS